MKTKSGKEKDHILRHIFKIRKINSENETCWETTTNAKINMKRRQIWTIQENSKMLDNG